MHTIAPTAPEVGRGWRQGLPKLTIAASRGVVDISGPPEVRGGDDWQNHAPQPFCRVSILKLRAKIAGPR